MSKSYAYLRYGRIVDDMKKVLRKGTCECTAVPVCCGSAYRNKGVQKLLDAIIEYMPAPTDIPAIKGVDLDGNEIERHSSDDEPFAALAFKIMADPFVGKLAYFRVYSGTCRSWFLRVSHSPNVCLDPRVYVHPAYETSGTGRQVWYCSSALGTCLEVCLP